MDCVAFDDHIRSSKRLSPYIHVEPKADVYSTRCKTFPGCSHCGVYSELLQ